MPTATADTINSAAFAAERIANQNPKNNAAARIKPVYLVPAVAPAKMPARIITPGDKSLRALKIESTHSGTNALIQMSGAPAVVVCQNTTGVSVNASAASQGHTPPIQNWFRRSVARAPTAPPKKSHPCARAPLPSRRPAKIN